MQQMAEKFSTIKGYYGKILRSKKVHIKEQE